MKTSLLFFLLILLTPLRGADNTPLIVSIETTKGNIEADLDYRRAPLTVMNFVGLAEGTLPFTGRPPGSKFYDGIAWHRVVKDFVIQCGDPQSADPAVPVDKLGEGGPGYSFPDEFDPRLRHDAAGVLQMANDGPDTNGSQFCITLAAANRLNYLHSVFGHVTSGLDVIQQIERGDKILHVTVKQRPPGYQVAAQAFEARKKEVLARRRPAAPAGFVYLVDETGQLPEFRVNNFNYKLANYERATGHRIVVRLLDERKPDDSAKAHAESLHLSDTGDNVLAVFFAKPDDAGWSLRLGEATYPALIGKPGATEQLMADGTLHRRKTELLSAAQDLSKSGKPKEAVDAVIDTLIQTFDDHAIK